MMKANVTFQGGYLFKRLRIDLSTRQVRVEEIDPAEYYQFLGGRGMGALWYWREIAPDVRPLGAENKIGFFAGPMTGAPLISTTKFQCATKSPETGRYLCANSSGYFGPYLREAGFDALILEGVSPSWTAVVIENGAVRFVDDENWKGLKTVDARRRLLDGLPQGRRWATMVVGPAAENEVAFSSIMVDDGRAFGRGGAGAVLASKRVKALAVRGDHKFPVYDIEKCRALTKNAIEFLKTSRAKHRMLGTAQFIEPVNALGAMPTRNFQTTWEDPETASGVIAQTMREKYFVRNYACYRCSIACGQMTEVKEGEFAGAAARPEYESIGILGPSCGVYDMAAVIAANQACDELGMDTITAGNMLGLVMELFQRGLVSAADNDGLEVHFGDGKALVQMLHFFAERRGLGKIIGKGALGIIAERPEWEPYIMHSRGLTFAAYDPRGFHGMGLSYATSSRGACHNVGGYTVYEELLSGKVDRFSPQGKGAMVKSLQDVRAYIDSTGLCTVARGGFQLTNQPNTEVLLAITGYDFAPRLVEIGERIINLERMILKREGVDRRLDTLPPRMREPVPNGPAAGHAVTQEILDAMLDEYYQLRGWDANGLPTAETLKKFDLEFTLV
ncbi:MAG: aldehyde ferredoxin oxidoreductase family protein [Anaerolineae bacterium]|nr:aldehyde ferredoxin oxidoreductase family protein [Anaerolineae bacterium]